MSTTTAKERFPERAISNYFGHSICASRAEGEPTAKMSTHGRSNKHERQEVADKMAKITETATVEKVGPNEYVVGFAVTHRILPISDLQHLEGLK